MPRIERYEPKIPIEVPKPSMGMLEPVISGSREARRNIIEGAQTIEKAVLGFVEREQKAKDTLDTIKFQNSLEEKKNEALSLLEEMPDENYDKYEDGIKNKIQEIDKVVRPKTASRDVQFAYERTLGNLNSQLQGFARRKKYIAMENIGKIEALTLKGNRLKKYAEATTDIERNIQKELYMGEMDKLKGDYVVNGLWIGVHKLDFEEKGNQLAIDLADVAADKAIEINPQKAYSDLGDTNYLPNLKPKQRQDKREKALSASKVFNAELEKKQKELDKKLHDDDDREVGNLFMKRQFTDAYNKAESSKYLTGYEKRVWATSIESASKKNEDEIDPIVENINYAFVNELIAKEVNPKTIKNYIFSYEFKKGTREKLLDRLDKETDQAVNKYKSRAYDYMKGQIMPYGGMLAEVPPLQSANYIKAMNSLDDWINRQRKADKPITQKDIQVKAEELALGFQTTIPERQEYKAKEDKEYFESLKKKKEEKIEAPVQGREYKTAEEVKSDYQTGKLSKDEALKILRNRFNFK